LLNPKKRIPYKIWNYSETIRENLKQCIENSREYLEAFEKDDNFVSRVAEECYLKHLQIFKPLIVRKLKQIQEKLNKPNFLNRLYSIFELLKTKGLLQIQEISSLSQDFAEAYAAWVSNGLDETKFPNRARWFKKHFGHLK